MSLEPERPAMRATLWWVVRSVVLIGAAVLGSTWIHDRLLTVDEHAPYVVDEFIDSTMLLLVLDLEERPPAQRARRLEALHDLLGSYPMTLVPDKEGPPPDGRNRAHLAIAPAEQGTEEDVYYYGSIDGDPRRLRIGPVRLAVDFDPASRTRASLAVIAVVSAATLLLLAPWIRRLAATHRVVQRLTHGDFSARTGERGGDPLGTLGRGIDYLADRVSGLLDHQRHLLGAVSHELRAPIARLRFRLEAMEDDDPAHTAALQGAERDLDELDALVAEVVTFVRGELSSEAPESVRVDADSDCFATADSSVTLRVEGMATAWVRPRAFRRAMTNLLRNAERHAAQTVVVRVTQEASGTTISVSDDGPGVPEQDRERIFEPFARLDTHRSRDDGGLGFGLTIVRSIVERHGGRVHVQTGPEGGACFVTWWPHTTA
jgi:two-component system, OmpR family, sensor histidine kinase RstB